MGEDEITVRTLEPPLPQSVFTYAINPVIKSVLRSPLHRLISGSLLLVTYTGRKSRTEYTIPVAYEQWDGTLYVTSQSDHVWWKNLRGGEAVTVQLRGEQFRGEAGVIEDNEAVAEYILGLIERRGIDSLNQHALTIDSDEVPTKEEIAIGLTETIVVRIELSDD